VKMRGLVQVFTGKGKGKTSASLGLALRAVGHDLKVYVIQFLKGGAYSGEFLAAEKIPNLTFKQFGKPCPYSDRMRAGEADCGNCRECFLTSEEEKKKSKAALAHAKKVSASGKFDVVILDEVNVALKKKLVTTKDALKLIKGKSEGTELILTGRGAPKEIIDAADVVTEMREVKHHMKRGGLGRWGIEY